MSLGAFDLNNSDIDFIAVISRKTTKTDINALRNIHKSIQRQYKKTILDGMYILKDDIESLCTGEISCIRFNDGMFQGFRTFDSNSIDAYILKAYGITVKGPTIENFQYTVDFDVLIYRMKDNINTYWKNWIKDCRKFPSIKYMSLYVNLKTIEWGVLGISRVYYTLIEKKITSKIGAGDYALKTVPKRWHKIINESMRLRKNIKNSYYISITKRRNDVLGYINYIIQESNKMTSVSSCESKFGG